MDIRNHKKELLFSIIIKKIDLDSLLEMIKEQLKTKNIPSGKIMLIPKTNYDTKMIFLEFEEFYWDLDKETLRQMQNTLPLF
ncbi:hypothetical protein GZ693_002181 [Campylobacter coli]|uniref:Uncharacterized protein n=1 Tax=Helicobacter pullorum TaxID=35818 RepID=A0A0N1EBK0_9HELI|nr:MULTISPECIES: hypothetical protein [Campylobacterales]EAI0449367.1 hypothetical protein [Campylobacter coli]EAI0449915.1 hypothetical protein [Campylobacter coli]EAI4223316.1 hypothetical protein [Campylobacter coli]EAI7500537.1 hypothetical protein [Campylobacter coli]EAI7500987.1 hypothetical protein [Campylobacter coli]